MDVSTSSNEGFKFCAAVRGTHVYVCAASWEPAAQTLRLCRVSGARGTDVYVCAVHVYGTKVFQTVFENAI